MKIYKKLFFIFMTVLGMNSADLYLKYPNRPIIGATLFTFELQRLLKFKIVQKVTNYDQVKQKCLNRYMHSLNGNKANKLGILHINKSKSDILTKIDLIRELIYDKKLNIHLVSIVEANFKLNDNLNNDLFPGYNIESKFMRGCDKARVIIRHGQSRTGMTVITILSQVYQ